MRKHNLIILLLLVFIGIQAQKQIRIHNSNQYIYQQKIDKIDSLKFQSDNSFIFLQSGKFELPILSIDSITFTNNVTSDIYITFMENAVEIINPYADNGVVITQNANHITITSTHETADLKYQILGTTSNGSVNISSTKSIVLVMSHANITNPTGAAISLNEKTKTVMYLSEGTVNTLSDGVASGDKGALCSNKSLTIAGTGSLNVNGYQKHGIYVDATLTVESGIINIAQASSDGIHTNHYVQNGGIITIIAESDGIDASKDISLNGGDLAIVAATDDVKGLKANALTINDGVYSITVSGKQSKAIKTVENTVVNGSYTLHYGRTISGGTNLNGYYTGATYSDGSSRSLTVNSRLVTLSI